MESLFWPLSFFGLAVLIELFLSKKNKLNLHSLEEDLSNICHGLSQVILNLSLKIPLFFIYNVFYKHFSFFEIKRSLTSGLLILLLIDLIYYGHHYLSHKIPLLWANHSVHHQAEKFNFTVGLRPPLLNEIFSFYIHIPLAILGVSPEIYVPLFIIHTSFQLLNHTKLIKKEIPFLRFIFVTPSHHRVHHGQNPRYMNKNFGALFSFWDRMFGTYVKEKEEVIFGIPHHTLEFNPLISNFTPLLGQKRIKTFFKRPAFFTLVPYLRPLTLFFFSLTAILCLGFLNIFDDLGPFVFLVISLYLFTTLCLVGSSLGHLAKTK
jgi:sterol desaturase/sphingolipid hydroxylase (fatty acid hydroxylase superfamily)